MAAHSLDTGLKGAYYNVCINLKQVKDEGYVSETTAQVEQVLRDSEAQLNAVLELVKNRS